MQQTISLLALLFSYVIALPQVEKRNPSLPIEYPTVEGVALNAQSCYYNERGLYLDGWEGKSLVPSTLSTAFLDPANVTPFPYFYCSEPGSSRLRPPVEDVTAVEKRSQLVLDVCNTRAQLNFTNLPNAGPWRTPMPEYFTPTKYHVLAWTPGVVVKSMKVFGVPTYGEDTWGAPSFKGLFCQVPKNPPQAYFVIPPRDDRQGPTMMEFEFDPSSLPVDKRVDLVLFDVNLKQSGA
ncbi:MAG: hypothetical protein Q9186_001560 [Xanthomendoza sp. 1 TL-2023]